MPRYKQKIREANAQIVANIKSELRLQGHYLTGALEASLIDRIEQEGKDTVLTAQALAYIESLEEGIPGYRISLDAESVREMANYVKLRMGYSGNYATKVAVAILKKQMKEGNPTKGSYAYSQTGDRLDAVKETFRKNETNYFELIEEGVVGDLDESFKKTKSGTI